MANKDHDLDRYANVRKSKLAGAEGETGTNPQEHWEDDFHFRTDADLASALAEYMDPHGYASQVRAARDEVAAAGAGTILRTDREFSCLSIETAATSGDLIRLLTERYWQQDRGPEVEARVRLGAGAAVLTNSRSEIGLYIDVPVNTDTNSPVSYAAIVRETERGNDGFLLCVAGRDYIGLTLDESAAAGAELADATTGLQNATANDTIIGINNGAAGAAVINDGLIFLNPRPIDAIVMTVGTAQTAVHTYTWEYFGTTAAGAANAWVAFTPDGTAPSFIAGGTGVGRKVMQVPAATRALQRPLATGDIVGVDATTANMPGGLSAIGRFGVRVRTTAVGAGAAPILNWASVEEQADLGIAAVENQWHVLRLRISNTAEPVVQAKIDNGGWGTVGPGAFDATTTRTINLAAKLQTFAAAAKRLDIDYWRCFQDRAV